MNKAKFNLIAAAVLTFALASCNDEEFVPDTGQSTSEARFSASIDAPATRAYNQVWEANDEIGISGTTGDVTYTNVRYFTANADGNFAPKNEADKIYYQTDEEVTFTGYYPWNNLTGGNTITADTWGQADQNSFDFLWAQAPGKKANPEVKFSFAHKMAKVVLTIKKGNDVSFDEVKAALLSLEGFKHEGSFDVTTGKTSTLDATTVMWKFAGNMENEAYNAPKTENTTNETISYTMIFFPQEFASALPFSAELADKQTFKADLDFTEANKVIDKDAAKNEWVAGRQYNLDIVLNKTGINVTGINVTDCEIKPWEEVNGGDTSAE